MAIEPDDIDASDSAVFVWGDPMSSAAFDH